MSLLKIFDVAGSALSAQTLRLNLIASNLANAEAVSSSVERTYRARHPVFEAVLEGERDDPAATAGVAVLGVVESPLPLRADYRPEHPLADDRGYIYRPNVNMVEELANLISASRSYEANLEVINTSKQLLQRTLNLGQ
jgi:flagellar basal-body rod protein FlgC